MLSDKMFRIDSTEKAFKECFSKLSLKSLVMLYGWELIECLFLGECTRWPRAQAQSSAHSSRDLKEKKRETLEAEDDAKTRLNSAMPFVFRSGVLTTVLTCWINHVAKRLSNNMSVFSSHRAIICAFMHLANNFIAINLHCIQTVYIYLVHSCILNWTHGWWCHYAELQYFLISDVIFLIVWVYVSMERPTSHKSFLVASWLHKSVQYFYVFLSLWFTEVFCLLTLLNCIMGS